MRSVFIFIINLSLIFLLGSCFGGDKDYELTVTTGKGGTSSSGDEDSGGSSSYSVNFEKELKDQISCNDSGKFYDPKEYKCTSKKLVACTDDDINEILEKAGIIMGKNFNWSNHYCTGKKNKVEVEDDEEDKDDEDDDKDKDDEDEDDEGVSSNSNDVSQYRQCYFSSKTVLQVYRVYDEGDGIAHIRTCTISELDIDEDDEDDDKDDEDEEED